MAEDRSSSRIRSRSEFISGKEPKHLGTSRSQNRINLFKKLEKDQIFFLASGLAFNLLICFLPLLLVVLSLVGFFLHSSQEILGHVKVYLDTLLPQSSPALTQNILQLIKDRT